MSHRMSNDVSSTHGSIFLPRTISVLTLLLVFLLAAPSSSAQTLSWASPTQQSTYAVGGQSGYGGVGTYYYAPTNLTYMVLNNYYNQGSLILTASVSGGVPVGGWTNPPFTFDGGTPISVSGGQTVYAASNPAITILNGKIYVGYIDNYGSATFVTSTDGHTWGSSLNLCGGDAATFSPTFTQFGGYVYMYYARASDHSLISCRITPSDNSVQLTVYAGSTMGNSPSAVVLNNTIYIGIVANDSSNKLYLFTSTDGNNYTFSTAPQASHSSTAPSLAVFNNILYMGFRQNDANSHSFFYNYSTNGTSFSGPILVNWSIGGPPSLSVSPNGKLCNMFRQNDYSSYLYSSCTN